MRLQRVASKQTSQQFDIAAKQAITTNNLQTLEAMYKSKTFAPTEEMLNLAIKTGSFSIVSWMLYQNIKGSIQSTILAATNNHDEILKLLVTNGFPVDEHICTEIATRMKFDLVDWILINRPQLNTLDFQSKLDYYKNMNKVGEVKQTTQQQSMQQQTTQQQSMQQQNLKRYNVPTIQISKTEEVDYSAIKNIYDPSPYHGYIITEKVTPEPQRVNYQNVIIPQSAKDIILFLEKDSLASYHDHILFELLDRNPALLDFLVKQDYIKINSLHFVMTISSSDLEGLKKLFNYSSVISIDECVTIAIKHDKLEIMEWLLQNSSNNIDSLKQVAIASHSINCLEFLVKKSKLLSERDLVEILKTESDILINWMVEFIKRYN